ncbi:MAG: hypothetical protein KAT70_07105, partial [Thermoplasmata archaeon]|nr:hypothetical protein [Thermoplasmata archaeon]
MNVRATKQVSRLIALLFILTLLSPLAFPPPMAQQPSGAPSALHSISKTALPPSFHGPFDIGNIEERDTVLPLDAHQCTHILGEEGGRTRGTEDSFIFYEDFEAGTAGWVMNDTNANNGVD